MDRGIILDDLNDIYSRDIPWEDLRDSTVLVTGAYGMLASYVMFMLIYLNEEKQMGINIIPVIRSKEKFDARFGRYAETEYMHPYYGTLDHQIEINGSVDFIIHAASFASPQYYDVCPVDVLKPNTIGTYNLLELAVIKKIKGFLLFSTGDIYGATRAAGEVKEKDMGTIDPLDIHSCYSESKRMAETMCYAYYHQYHVPVKIARIWHTYAPTMDIEHDPRVFASFVKNIKNGEDIVMNSDGSGRRTFCYITDAAAGYFTVLLKGVTGEAYNVCNTSQYYSIKSLAETIAGLDEKKGIKVITKTRSKDEHYTENTAIGDTPPSDLKLKGLGWDPKIDVPSGFGRVLRFLGEEEV